MEIKREKLQRREKSFKKYILHYLEKTVYRKEIGFGAPAGI